MAHARIPWIQIVHARTAADILAATPPRTRGAGPITGELKALGEDFGNGVSAWARWMIGLMVFLHLQLSTFIPLSCCYLSLLST